jgi:hypothetical protein
MIRPEKAITHLKQNLPKYSLLDKVTTPLDGALEGTLLLHNVTPITYSVNTNGPYPNGTLASLLAGCVLQEENFLFESVRNEGGRENLNDCSKNTINYSTIREINAFFNVNFHKAFARLILPSHSFSLFDTTAHSNPMFSLNYVLSSSEEFEQGFLGDFFNTLIYTDQSRPPLMQHQYTKAIYAFAKGFGTVSRSNFKFKNNVSTSKTEITYMLDLGADYFTSSLAVFL